MNTMQITVQCKIDGALVHKQVTALPTETEGLVVHRTPWSNRAPEDADAECWSVTHGRSGLAVTNCNNPEMAAFIAARLNGFTDWTANAAAVVTAMKGNPALYEIINTPTRRWFGKATTSEYRDLNEVAS